MRLAKFSDSTTLIERICRRVHDGERVCFLVGSALSRSPIGNLELIDLRPSHFILEFPALDERSPLAASAAIEQSRLAK